MKGIHQFTTTAAAILLIIIDSITLIDNKP